MTKEQILAKINELETKADHYSRTDWNRYTDILEEIYALDKKLLDIYNDENINWLQKTIA